MASSYTGLSIPLLLIAVLIIVGFFGGAWLASIPWWGYLMAFGALILLIRR